MFEDRILAGDQAYRSDDTPMGDGAESLRPVAWDDLVARFGAARELRQAIHREKPGLIGSFAVPLAQRMVGVAHGKPDVNPVGLANRKDARSNVWGDRIDAVIGDRGME